MKRLALTTTIEVIIAADFVGADLAELLLAGYAPSEERPELVFHLANDRIVGEARYVDRVEDPDDVVPMFELDLYQEVAWRSSPGWLLHAAALEYEGGAFVFAGPSGAGKTTLTLALMARGWKLLTEEMVLIDRDLSVRGLARPIHTTDRNLVPADWRAAAYPLRTDAGTGTTVIAQPPASARQLMPRPLRALIRLDHGPDLADELVVLPPHRAVERIWEATLRKDAAGLAAASAIVTACRPRELRSSSTASALAQVLDFTRTITK